MTMNPETEHNTHQTNGIKYYLIMYQTRKLGIRTGKLNHGENDDNFRNKAELFEKLWGKWHVQMYNIEE